MRRLVLLAIALVAATAVAGLARRWWTAPPAAPANALAAAAGGAPANAEGLVVLAEPRRAARWLFSHRAALGLMPIAAPRATNAFDTLLPVVRALVADTDGPLALWWRGSDGAIAAAVSPGGRDALRQLAALQGLAFRRDDALVAVATAPSLLAEGPRVMLPALVPAQLTLFARVGDRWWTGSATRSALLLRAGNAPVLPPAARASSVRTRDVAAFFALLSAPADLVHGPACLVLTPGQGWGVAFPAAGLPDALRLLLGVRSAQPAAGAPAGAQRWQGLFGTLFVLPRNGATLADDVAMLTAVADCNDRREEGSVHGRDLAWAVERAADAAGRVPILDAHAQRWAHAAPALAELASARWQFSPAGASVDLEW